MKKLVVVLVFACIAVKMFSQDAIQFLGIPVDGTEKDMITALESKGFKYNIIEECLYGEFNGEDVEIHIVTNKNRVWRIYVKDRYPRDEYQIKLRYNMLCKQFENNPRYTSLISSGQRIPMEEDIYYEMQVNDKHYGAFFYQFVSDSSPLSEDLSEFVEQYIEDYDYPYLNDEDSLVIQDSMTVRQQRETLKFTTGLLSYFTDRFLKNGNDFIIQLDSIPEYEIRSVAMAMTEDFISILENRKVWFTIHGSVDNYYISMYYDNIYNRASGEDL